MQRALPEELARRILGWSLDLLGDQASTDPRGGWVHGPRGSGELTLARLVAGVLEGAALPGARMAVVLDAGACGPLLPALVERVAQRLDLTTAPRAGRSPRDAVEAIHAMLRSLAPGWTMFLVLDDLARRLGEDRAARRTLAPFLGHLARRLRGRARVIGVGDATLEEGDDLADLFPPELRLAIAVDTVGEPGRTAADDTWETARASWDVSDQESSERVRDALGRILLPLSGVDRDALYADGKIAHDVRLLPDRREGALVVSFQHLPVHRRSATLWEDKSTWARLRGRLHWVAGGDPAGVRETAAELSRSCRMLAIHDGPLAAGIARRARIHDERARRQGLERRMEEAVAATFLEGAFYLRGERREARSFGETFEAALAAAIRWTRATPG